MDMEEIMPTENTEMQNAINDVRVNIDLLLSRLYKIHGDVVLDRQFAKYRKSLKIALEIAENVAAVKDKANS
jgi:hypothetical protein